MALPPLVAPIDALTPTERARTARNASLAALGDIGQRRIAAAQVAVVGAGGLGSPVILGLTAAGIGKLTVIDDDVVEASNLQRQVLHRLEDVGMPKVDSAVRAGTELAPETSVHTVRERLTPENAARMLEGADLVIDGTDTFDTREAVAAACEQLGIPLVWGVVQEFDAQVTVFWSSPPAGVPPVLLRDLYPPGTVGELPTCAAVGVLGTVCLQVGALLATEAIKLITGIGEPLLGRVLVLDGLNARQEEVPLRGMDAGAAVLDEGTDAGGATPAAAASIVRSISPRELAEVLHRNAGITVVDVREADEVSTGMLPGAVHIPLTVLLADPSAVTGPAVVVCRVGPRAERAVRALADVGVDAVVLSGGMLAWHDLHADRLS